MIVGELLENSQTEKMAGRTSAVESAAYRYITKTIFRSPRTMYALFLAGFGLSVAGFVSPFWLHRKFIGYSHSQGLWKWCIWWPVFSTCSDMAAKPGFWYTIQVLETISVVLSCCALVFFTAFQIWTWPKSRTVLKVAIGFCFSSVFVSMRAVAGFVFIFVFDDQGAFIASNLSATFFTIKDIGWAIYVVSLGNLLMFTSGYLSLKTIEDLQIS